MKINLIALRSCLWLWLLTFFAINATAQSFSEGMQTGVLRIKVKPELVQAQPGGLKTKMLNDVAVTGIRALDALSEQYDVKSIERVFRYSPKNEALHQKYGLHLWYTVTFNAKASPKQLSAAYAKLNEIERAEPVLEKTMVPYALTELKPSANKSAAALPFNDTHLDKQWHYSNTGQNGGTPGSDINLFNAWQTTAGNRKVIVSIHDTGLDVTHEDLADNIWINEAELNGIKGVDDDGNGYRDDVYGYNFSDNVPDISKGDHGTHVGGTISAVNNNGKGVSGIAGGTGNHDGVRLMACQIMGGSWTDLVAESYVYAADHGAVISQNSWGYQNPYNYEQVVLDAIDYFIAEAGRNTDSPMKGGVVIFASGNSSTDLPMYPGFYEPVVAVSAIGPRFERAPYSNYGDWVEISAPGGNNDWGTASSVLSTIPNNKYGYMDGTSMACPHVSGVAALIVSRHGNATYTNQMLKKALLTGISDQIYKIETNAPYQGLLGSGMVDAVKAIAQDQKKAPNAISTLSLKGIAQDFANIQWLVPADEDDDLPVEFEVLYATNPLTASNVASAKSIKLKNTQPVGAEVSLEIKDLAVLTTYYFYVRSIDRWGNVSVLSNEVTGTTNRGPKISADITSLTTTIDVTNSTQGSVAFNILNGDEGLLKWTGEVRHISSQDYNRSSFQYPTSGVKAGRPEIGKLQFQAEQSEGLVTPYGQEISSKEYLFFNPYGGLYVIGEQNLKLTNSMASKFVVTSPEGFNLTHAKILLKHDNTTGPAIFEVRVGETLKDAKITYIEERKSSTTESAFHNFALKEQIFFPQGSTFWMVVHVPSGNLYPLGCGFEVEKELSDYSFYSSNMGETWNKLEDVYYENRLVWAMIPQEKLKTMGEYVTLMPDGGEVEYNNSVEVTAQVDASQIVNGTYKANLLLHSNDKDQPIVRIPYKLEVRGHKPKFNLPEIIDMGSCLLGQSITKTIELNNLGYGALAYPSVKLSNPLFKVKGSSPYMISALGTQSLTIEFKPESSGNENCILTISDSKGNSFSTNLFAVTAEPPVITITPEKMSHSGLLIGDEAQGSFTISNTGKYPLKYYFPSFADAGATQTAIDKYEHFFGYQYLVTNSEEELQWKDIATTGTDHSADLKNLFNTYLEVDLGFGFPFFGKVEQKGYLTRYGIFAFDQNSAFNVQPLTFKDSESNDRFISAFGMGLDMSGNARIFTQRFSDHFIIQYQDCGIAQFDWMTGEKVMLPVTFQIILFDNGDIEYKYKNVNMVDEYARMEQVMLAIEDQTLVDGLCINDLYYQNLMVEDNVKIHIANSGYGAVEILNNTRGTLLVGQSAEINYKLNTNKLSQGMFTEKVAILSNDPVTPNAYALFDIEIVGGGTATVSADKQELDFGKCFKGGAKAMEVQISNSGNASVNINSASLNSDRFAISINEFPYDLKYRHTLYLRVNINTDQIGMFEDVLTLNYGDNQTIEIPLKGEITPAPMISASLDAINETLAAGDSKQLQMTISNDGGFDLEVAPKGNEWMVVSEATPSENSVADYSLVSNEKGSTDALYNWIDITDGYKFPMADSPDEYFNEVELPWELTFYGKKYSKIYVAFNGLICFDKLEYQEEFYFGQYEYSPSPSQPNNYIAACWGYLGPIYQETPGKEGFYIKAFEDMVVVSFEDYINGFGMGDPMSAQVILYKNGNIKLQYKLGSMDWTASRVGISAENSDGTKGVQISFYEESRIKDKMAFILSPSTHTSIAPGASADFNVTVDATSLIGGNYQGELMLANNTPDHGDFSIPAQLTVEGNAVINTVESIDLGEIVILQVLDEYGDEIYQPYSKEIELSNVGKGALEIYQIGMENAFEMATSSWMNVYIDGVWGGSYQWVMTDDPWSMTYPIVLLPGEKITLKAQVNPTETHSLIEDRLMVESNIGSLAIPFTANAILPPAMSVDEAGVTVVANNRNFKESRKFTISNAAGQSELRVNCLLAFDRGEAASAAPRKQTTMAANATPAAELKMVDAAPVSASPATTYAATEERSLSHSDKEQAENFIGFGGGVVFDAATSFKAPINGFNLTDVMTFIRLEENTSIQMMVTILAGKDINSATTLFTQTFDIASEGDEVNKGNYRRMKLSENQIMLPGEVFHVVFSYPSEIKYPQGIVEVGENSGNRCFYYDTSNSRWADFNAIADFAEKAFLAKAVEAEYKSAAWVELSGETALTIPAGAEADVTLDFIGGYAQGAKNIASLVISSNDQKNSEAEVPVTMLMNQAPVFETGSECHFNISENEQLDVTISATDAEENAITITTNANITGLTATPSDNQLLISYHPTFDDAGSYQFTATATDEHGNATECVVHIEVAQTNRAPQVVANIENKNYRLTEDNDFINFADVFADPDGDVLTFKVSSSTEAIVECYASETALFIQPLTIGTTILTVTATDAHNMSVSTTFTVEVMNRVGIDELVNAGIKVYPIPADDFVNIQWSQLIPGNVIIKLNGADGKLLKEKTIETSSFAGEYQLSLTGLSSGIYFIEMVSEGESITKRVLKK